VLQSVRPYFSPDDVEKGSRWSSEISKELGASQVGLLVITPENQASPWLLFEAGALAKSFDRSKVCPILFGEMEPTDVKGPLVQFQAAKFSKEEMTRVIKTLNAECGEAALQPETLSDVVEMWCPKLEEEIAARLESPAEAGEAARRSDRDLLEEVLELTRRVAMDSPRTIDISHPAWDDLVGGIVGLAKLAYPGTPSSEMAEAMKTCLRPLNYFFRHGSHQDVGLGRLRSLDKLREIQRMVAIDSPEDLDKGRPDVSP
jgi:lambda repressor-like predicted transcriptional regulator